MFPNPPPRLDGLTVEQLVHYLDETWALDAWLFSGLVDPRALHQPVDPLGRPLLFHFGRNAACFASLLRGLGLDAPADAAWDDVESVRAYRAQVHSTSREQLSHLPSVGEYVGRAALMGAELARVQLEAVSVLIRSLPVDWIQAPAGWEAADRGAPGDRPSWVPIGAARVPLGKPRDWPEWGWDAEYGQRIDEVAAFEAESVPVTNGRFRAFVDDEGYHRRGLWTAEGWTWRTRVGAEAPRFWTEAGLRTVFADGPMADGWPVEVNRYEAEAFCRWFGGGACLPTEAEHLALCEHFRAGSAALNLSSHSPTAVVAEAAPGNVWSWLADDFGPLPGYVADPLQAGVWPSQFAGHGMVAGGSWATTGQGTSPLHRRGARPHAHLHAGFRMVRDCEDERVRQAVA